MPDLFQKDSLMSMVNVQFEDIGDDINENISFFENPEKVTFSKMVIVAFFHL